jgi:hypothetical protein
MVGVLCPTQQNKGERTSVGGVVGHIRKRIALILLKQPLLTQILTNLAPTERHMAMM